MGYLDLAAPRHLVVARADGAVALVERLLLSERLVAKAANARHCTVCLGKRNRVSVELGKRVFNFFWDCCGADKVAIGANAADLLAVDGDDDIFREALVRIGIAAQNQLLVVDEKRHLGRLEMRGGVVHRLRDARILEDFLVVVNQLVNPRALLAREALGRLLDEAARKVVADLAIVHVLGELGDRLVVGVISAREARLLALGLDHDLHCCECVCWSFVRV